MSSLADIAAAALAPRYPGLVASVSPRDDVYRWHASAGVAPERALSDYLRIGQEYCESTLAIASWLGLGPERGTRILDYASGYGRGTRFLVTRWPARDLEVTDVDEHAISFQRDVLGLAGTVVAAAPDAVSLERRFGIVTTFALFSNLPEALFAPMLARVFALVETGGVLLFTTSSIALLPDDDPRKRSESFVFLPVSESTVLPRSVYGSTVVSEEYVAKLVRALPGATWSRTFRAVFGGSQDLRVVAKGLQEPVGEPHLVGLPRLDVDRVTRDAHGRLAVEGWALDGRRCPVAGGRVLLGAREVPSGQERVPRDDLVRAFGVDSARDGGFRCVVDVPEVRAAGPVDHLSVVVHDGGGRLVWGAKALTTPRAEELARRGRDVLAYGGGLFSLVDADRHPEGHYPHFARSARGCHVVDFAGRRHVDWFLGWGPMLLGHCHPDVDAAVTRQLELGTSPSLMGELEVEVAETLRATIPCAEQVAFGKNGSDVTLAAVRVARAATGRDLVLCHGYHGFHDWYQALHPECLGVPSALRAGIEAFPFDDLPALARMLDERRGRVAAIILEPAGSRMPSPGYLEGLRALVHAHGALLIFDEIVTGFRIARGGAQERFGVVPDLATFGKALANGLPLSALVGRREHMRHLARCGFGLTFRGELLSLAAARECLRIFAREPVAEHVERVGEAMRTGFAEVAARRGLQLGLVGMAGRMSFSFVKCGRIAPHGVRMLFVQECVRHGLLTNGNLMPSYAHDADAISESLAILDRALETVTRAAEIGDLGPFLHQPVLPTYYDSL